MGKRGERTDETKEGGQGREEINKIKERELK